MSVLLMLYIYITKWLLSLATETLSNTSLPSAGLLSCGPVCGEAGSLSHAQWLRVDNGILWYPGAGWPH